MNDKEMKDVEKYVDEAVEKALKVVEMRGSQDQGAGVGVFYSRLRHQLDELSLQVSDLTDILIQALPVLRKLDPSFDDHQLLESCNEWKKKHKLHGEADYDRW